MIKIFIFLAIILIMPFVLKMLSTNYDKCYSSMEYRGVAAMGCCNGVVGGSRDTEYLSESCIECPYFILPDKEDKSNEQRI